MNKLCFSANGKTKQFGRHQSWWWCCWLGRGGILKGLSLFSTIYTWLVPTLVCLFVCAKYFVILAIISPKIHFPVQRSNQPTNFIPNVNVLSEGISLGVDKLLKGFYMLRMVHTGGSGVWFETILNMRYVRLEDNSSNNDLSLIPCL